MRPRATGGERGASLVEFALVVPLLTLFLFGIVQFGIAYDKQQSINSAAREGARLGALDTTTMSDISVRAIEAYSASAAAGDDPRVEVFDDTAVAPVGVRTSAGAYTVTSASTHPNPQPAAEDDETRMPCGRDAPSDYLRVTVTTPYDITIPFFGVMTVDIDAKAEFRCE